MFFPNSSAHDILAIQSNTNRTTFSPFIVNFDRKDRNRRVQIIVNGVRTSVYMVVGEDGVCFFEYYEGVEDDIVGRIAEKDFFKENSDKKIFKEKISDKKIFKEKNTDKDLKKNRIRITKNNSNNIPFSDSELYFKKKVSDRKSNLLKRYTFFNFYRLKKKQKIIELLKSPQHTLFLYSRIKRLFHLIFFKKNISFTKCSEEITDDVIKCSKWFVCEYEDDCLCVNLNDEFVLERGMFFSLYFYCVEGDYELVYRKFKSFFVEKFLLKIMKINKRKVKVPDEDDSVILSRLLNKKCNTVEFIKKDDFQNVSLVVYIYKYNIKDKLIISDIDGTITKSDIIGHLYDFIGRDYSHCGIAELFTKIEKQNYRIIYLSNRPVSMYYRTRKLIGNLRQDGFGMPDGPVVLSEGGVVGSLVREMGGAAYTVKVEVLMGIRELFRCRCGDGDVVRREGFKKEIERFEREVKEEGVKKDVKREDVKKKDVKKEDVKKEDVKKEDVKKEVKEELKGEKELLEHDFNNLNCAVKEPMNKSKIESTFDSKNESTFESKNESVVQINSSDENKEILENDSRINSSNNFLKNNSTECLEPKNQKNNQNNDQKNNQSIISSKNNSTKCLEPKNNSISFKNITPLKKHPSTHKKEFIISTHKKSNLCESCLGHTTLTPKNNPFFSAFGNKLSDLISYKKVGIDKKKIFIIGSDGRINNDLWGYGGFVGVEGRVFPFVGGDDGGYGDYWYFRGCRKE